MKFKKGNTYKFKSRICNAHGTVAIKKDNQSLYTTSWEIYSSSGEKDTYKGLRYTELQLNQWATLKKVQLVRKKEPKNKHRKLVM